VKNKYLLFRVDFSGVSDKLFSELSKKGLQIEEHNIPKIWRLYFFAIITSFSLNYKKWIIKAERKYNLLQKTGWAFRLKSNWCAKIIDSVDVADYAAVIQVSGTFDAMAYSKAKLPFFILTDYTMELAAQKQLQSIKPLLPPSELELLNWYRNETKLYQRADKIIVPSEYITNSLKTFYSIDSEKLVTVGYGSNLLPSSVVKKQIIDPYDIKLLFVGKMFKQKGGEEILAALDLLKSHYPKITLTIVGPRVNPCPNHDSVIYLGRIYDKEKLARLYRQANLFIIHSAYEAFGLVLLEAMAFGTPCIGSNIDAMPDILVKTGAGRVADLGDIDAIKNEILHLIENPLAYKKASIAGINAVNNYYNWEIVSDKFFSAVTEHV
jgi:glycosyltransferase involved in cell wall biosynthesis